MPGELRSLEALHTASTECLPMSSAVLPFTQSGILPFDLLVCWRRLRRWGPLRYLPSPLCRCAGVRLAQLIGSTSPVVGREVHDEELVSMYCIAALNRVLSVFLDLAKQAALAEHVEGISTVVYLLGQFDPLLLAGCECEMVHVEALCGPFISLALKTLVSVSSARRIGSGPCGMSANLWRDLMLVLDGCCLALCSAALLHLSLPRVPLDVVDRLATIHSVRKQSVGVAVDQLSSEVSASESVGLAIHLIPSAEMYEEDADIRDILTVAHSETVAEHWGHCIRATGRVDSNSVTFSDLFDFLRPLVQASAGGGFASEADVVSLLCLILACVCSAPGVGSQLAMSPMAETVMAILGAGRCSGGDFASVVRNAAVLQRVVTEEGKCTAEDLVRHIEQRESVFMSAVSGYVDRLDDIFSPTFPDVCGPILGALSGLRTGMRVASCAGLSCVSGFRIDTQSTKGGAFYDGVDVVKRLVSSLLHPMANVGAVGVCSVASYSLLGVTEALIGPDVETGLVLLRPSLRAGDGAAAEESQARHKIVGSLLEQAMRVGCSCAPGRWSPHVG